MFRYWKDPNVDTLTLEIHINSFHTYLGIVRAPDHFVNQTEFKEDKVQGEVRSVS